ncbi:MAG: aminotransferase class I/II-fold pyridoxal phosphate-dependent enzyme [Rhodobacteraceae bacterium]|nr:aminotransferase class I/II-fold pyridoxal phosphate-dependent enzyme [Paracoccaceae bacterium]
MAKTYSKQTVAVQGGVLRSQFGETSEAIFLTQGFVYDSAEQAEARFSQAQPNEFTYSRYGNPTTRMLENRMAQIEGTEDGFATASGMAAVNGSLCAILKAGDHVVASRVLFGSCLYILENILPKFGIQVDFVDGTDNQQWAHKVKPNTRAVFFESLANPTLELVDVEFVSKLAQKNNAITIADNALATPLFLPAHELGINVVVYSTTKHTDGQGRAIGGIVLGTKDFIRGPLESYMKHSGGAPSPFNSWIMLKSLDTLNLRVNYQADTAMHVATNLEKSTKIRKVIYPHLKSHPQYTLAKKQMKKGGTVFAIEVEGGKEGAFRFMNNLKIFRVTNNFGDAKSLVTHPATTTHQRLTQAQRNSFGIHDGLVRVSVGLEDRDDILEDLDTAIQAI